MIENGTACLDYEFLKSEMINKLFVKTAVWQK